MNFDWVVVDRPIPPHPLTLDTIEHAPFIYPEGDDIAIGPLGTAVNLPFPLYYLNEHIAYFFTHGG
jgi:hypothetical protein